MSGQRFSSYIAGQWVEGDGGHADENPSDLASPVGVYGTLDAARTAQAVEAAAAALPKWSLSTPQQRADILDAVGSALAVSAATRRYRQPTDADLKRLGINPAQFHGIRRY